MARDERNRVWRLAAPETAVTALLVVAIPRVSTPVLALATGSTRLPQWDMAKYGVSGLRLARALQDIDLLAFLRHLNGLDVWPPVFPLLEVPVFLLAGPGYASARGLVATLFVMAIVAGFWSGLQSHCRLGFAVGALAHPYKQPRFFFLTAVLLWVAGSREAVELLSRAIHRVQESSQRLLAATLAGAGLLTATVTTVDADRLLRGHRQHTVNASTAEVLNVITDEAAKVRYSILLGTWNHLSPWLVEWSCLQRGPSMDPDQVPQAPAGRARRSNVVKWLATDPPDLVMVLSAQPDSAPRPGFRSKTRWLQPVRKQLVRDPRFHLVSRKDIPDTHYRIECFESTRADREPVPR